MPLARDLAAGYRVIGVDCSAAQVERPRQLILRRSLGAQVVILPDLALQQGVVGWNRSTLP